MTAVLAAAGSGERLGAGRPKAFVPLAGRPLIEWSLDALRACAAVDAIVVAVPPGGGRELAAGPGLRLVDGGETRARSVANALTAVETELVAIHDAARPLLTPALVEALVTDLMADSEAAGVIAASPLTDTVKLAADEPSGGTKSAFRPHIGRNALLVEQTLDRSRLWAAQTPQVFRTGALRAALDAHGERGDPAAGESPTDEAMLVEQAGGRVLLHPVAEPNLKVTTPLDLRLAELLLAERFAP